MKIVVIGPIGGSGKTAIARALADDFGLRYCSIDPLDRDGEPFDNDAKECVIDCPPEVTPLVRVALQCADRVVLVLKMPHLVTPANVTAVAKLVSAQTSLCKPGLPIIIVRMGGQQAFLQPSSDEVDAYMATMYRGVPKVRLVKPYGIIIGNRATTETAKAIYDLCRQ